jgi:hypothetical protein
MAVLSNQLRYRSYVGPGSVDLSDADLDRYEFLMRNLFMLVAERNGDDHNSRMY